MIVKNVGLSRYKIHNNKLSQAKKREITEILQACITDLLQALSPEILFLFPTPTKKNPKSRVKMPSLKKALHTFLRLNKS